MLCVCARPSSKQDAVAQLMHEINEEDTIIMQLYIAELGPVFTGHPLLEFFLPRPSGTT